MTVIKIPPARPGASREVRHLLKFKLGKGLDNFYNLYVAPVYSLAFTLTGNHASAAELVEKATARALDRSPLWPRDMSMLSWMRGNVIHMWMRGSKPAAPPAAAKTADGESAGQTGAGGNRRGGRRGRRPEPRRREPAGPALLRPSFSEEGGLPSTADWSGRIADENARPQAAEALLAASRDLPPFLRVAWVLRDVERLKSEEVAEILNLSLPMMVSRLHRARLHLREALARQPVAAAPPASAADPETGAGGDSTAGEAAAAGPAEIGATPGTDEARGAGEPSADGTDNSGAKPGEPS